MFFAVPSSETTPSNISRTVFAVSGGEHTMAYREIYAGWQADPEAFWLEAARQIDWTTEPSKALNDARAPLYEWFTDATVNTCWNAVDRHVEAGRVAIDQVHDPVGRHVRAATLQRDDQLDLVVQVLRRLRVGQGGTVHHDRVRRLHEEERVLARRVAAHLAGMRRVVAPDAVDAAHREHLVAALDRDIHRRDLEGRTDLGLRRDGQGTSRDCARRDQGRSLEEVPSVHAVSLF